MAKKYTLPKDSLKRIVMIMEYIEERNENATYMKLKRKFGGDGYHLFERYCLGGNEPYAEMILTTQSHKLNQTGIRKLYELRKILTDERKVEQQIYTNLMIAFGGAAVVFISGVTSMISLNLLVRQESVLPAFFGGMIMILIFIALFFTFKLYHTISDTPKFGKK